MIRMEILMVNDGSLLLQVMGCLLETRGYRLVLTDSSEEALVLLKTRNFNLVIVKINGKQIDRLSLMLMVKELNAAAKLIIMAEAAHPPVEIFEVEPDDYILLPCRNGEIWRRLSIYLKPIPRKLSGIREKSLMRLVSQRLFNRMSLTYQDLQGVATAIAKDLDLLNLHLQGKVPGEVETALQNTQEKTQALISLTKDFFRQVLYDKPTDKPASFIDLNEEVAPPSVGKPGQGL